jgi:hypothetical protein
MLQHDGAIARRRLSGTRGELRLQFAQELDPSKRKQIAEQVQLRYLKIVTHVHLGEWFVVTAFRNTVDLSEWPNSPPVTLLLEPREEILSAADLRF